jgi:hypothetical protein
MADMNSSSVSINGTVFEPISNAEDNVLELVKRF